MKQSQVSNPTERGPIRWRRWIVGTVFCLALLLLIAHGIWGWSSERRLRATINALRGRGEWTRLQDLVMPEVSDSANAVPDWEAAAAAINANTPARKRYYAESSGPDWPCSDEKRALKATLIEEGRPALALATRAAHKSQVAWFVDAKSPPLDVLLPGRLSTSRELANLLYDAAREAHLSGDDCESLDRLAQLLQWGRTLDQRPGGLVIHLVAVGCQALGCDAIRQLLPELTVDASVGSTTRPSRVATREQVQRLVAFLSDEPAQRDGFKRAIAGERVLLFELANATLSGGAVSLSSGRNTAFGSPSWQTSMKLYALRPTILGDEVILADQLEKVIAAGKEPDLPSALRTWGKFDRRALEPQYLHLWGNIFVAGYDRMLTTEFRTLTTRRLTLCALALRLYAIDHAGHLPEALNALVPAYLAAVPADPMASASSLRYLPRADDPILYSVGDDGIDGGGSDAPKPSLKARFRSGEKPEGWDCEDFVVHLAPRR